MKVFAVKTKMTRKPRRKRFFRFVKVLVSLILMGMIYSLGIAIAENIQVDRHIENFKKRGVFESEVNYEYSSGVFQVRRYYKVSRETSYELSDTRSVYYQSNRKFLGQKGDIFVTQDSPFPYSPLGHLFVSYYFGGHAAINDGNNRFVEAVGFPQDDETIFDFIFHPGEEPHDFSATVSKSGTNYWLDPRYRHEADQEYPYYGSSYRKEFVGLRVKDIASEQIDGAVAYAEEKIDKNLYNFLFFLDMKYKFYCTDLVSRAYQSVMVEEGRQRNYSRALNDDRFITSVNDLILSKETYMIFYVEIIDDVWHIYYLEDVN